jgi:hypothetical protein
LTQCVYTEPGNKEVGSKAAARQQLTCTDHPIVALIGSEQQMTGRDSRVAV